MVQPDGCLPKFEFTLAITYFLLFKLQTNHAGLVSTVPRRHQSPTILFHLLHPLSLNVFRLSSLKSFRNDKSERSLGISVVIEAFLIITHAAPLYVYRFVSCAVSAAAQGVGNQPSSQSQNYCHYYYCLPPHHHSLLRP